MRASRRTILSAVALVLVSALVTAFLAVAVDRNTDQPSRTIRPGLATMYLSLPDGAAVTLHQGDDRLVDPQLTRKGELTAVRLPLLWTGEYELRWGSGGMTLDVADPDNEWTTLAECAASPDQTQATVCAAEIMPALVTELGPSAARNELLSVSEQYPGFGESCDQWAMALAEAVVQSVGVEAAYTADAQICRFSYMHGVVAAAALRQYDRDALVALCTIPNPRVDEYSRTTQCGHGVGHGALTVSYGDTGAALQWCDAVTDQSGARFNCNEGVYMHLQMEVSLAPRNTAAELGGPQPLRRMGLPEDCPSAGYDNGNACFRYTMVYALGEADAEEHTALLEGWNKLCRSSETDGCWFGLGDAAIRQYVGQIGNPDAPLSTSEIESILALCSDDAGVNRMCAMRFLTLSIWSTLDITAVEPVCAALRARELDLCNSEEVKVWEKMMSQTASVDPRFQGSK